MPPTNHIPTAEEVAAIQNSNLGHLNLVPEFTGSSGVSVQNFFDRLDEMSLMGNWTKSQQAIIARMKLKGDASAYVQANPALRKSTYENLKTSLIAWFRTDISVEKLNEEFSACVMRNTETIQQFATRLSIAGYRTQQDGEDEGEQAYAKKALERALLTQFLKGIGGNLKRFVMTHRPKTYEEAIELALHEEAAEASMGCESAAIVGAVRREPQGKNYPNQTREQQAPNFPNFNSRSQPFQNLTSRPQKFNNYPFHNQQRHPGNPLPQILPSNVTCFCCGGRGHYANVCPSKSPGMSQQAARPVIICTYCNKRGHLEPQCWNKRGPNGTVENGRYLPGREPKENQKQTIQTSNEPPKENGQYTAQTSF